MWGCIQEACSSQPAHTHSYRRKTFYLQYLPPVNSRDLCQHDETFGKFVLKLSRNFVSKWVLKAHQLTHERNNTPNFQCLDCSRFFTTRGTLNRHKASHSDSRPFICPYCQKTFKTYSVCKKHVRTHTNEVIHMVRILSTLLY